MVILILIRGGKYKLFKGHTKKENIVVIITILFLWPVVAIYSLLDDIINYKDFL
jgi:hypothetical protein